MLLKLYDKNNNPQDLQRVTDILNDGGLIIYPTDTMYAIGCHGLKERAIERICRIKDIDPRKNNLSIICYDLSSISEYGSVVVIIGASSKRAISRMILLSGIRIPTSFRLRKILGSRLVPFRINVNGPGRLCFMSLNSLLPTLAYSLILLRS